MGDEERVMYLRLTAAQYDIMVLALHLIVTQYWRDDSQFKTYRNMLTRGTERLTRAWELGSKY